MSKLSVLIFSKEDTKRTLDLIKEVHDVADEIVLIVSDPDGISGWQKRKKVLKLNNLRVFYIIPFGYPDPGRVYGVKKCRYDWILHLDTDERISNALKVDIKDIIKGTSSSGFAIKRLEGKKNKSLNKKFTWKIRLFRKNRVTFTGTIHNLPKINGKVSKLNSKDYFITHEKEHPNNKQECRYFLIEAHTRRLSRNDVMALARNRGLPTFPLSIYFKAKNVIMSNELSQFEYNRFLLAYSIAIYLSKFLKSQYIGWAGGFRYTYDYNKRKIKYFFNFSEEDRKLQFNISQDIVKAHGVIKYLSLNKNYVVMLLNKKFGSSDISGLGLFIYLLKRRHSHGPEYFKTL